ncbi:MAG: hypothetical protein U0350_05310 [Caldilineaceae bacterium]
MTNKLFNRNFYSEPEMQALFAKYFPIEPLPADFATQLKARVLQEVALVIKPTQEEIQLLPRWLNAVKPRFLRTFLHRALMLMLVSTLLLVLGAFFYDAFLDADQDIHST